MEFGTIIASVLGFLAAVFTDYMSRRQTTDVNASIAAEGEVAGSVHPAEATEVVAPAIQADKRVPYVAVDILRASVRPLVTYAFMGTFIGLKIAAFYYGVVVGTPLVLDVYPVIWNDSSETIFAAVLSFWFGSRAIRRAKS